MLFPVRRLPVEEVVPPIVDGGFPDVISSDPGIGSEDDVRSILDPQETSDGNFLVFESTVDEGHI